jgi:hypothetical protein
MGDDRGFDDRFDDGLFRTSLNNSRRARPRKWPKSVSEMRPYTVYGGQGMHGSHVTEHSAYSVHHPPAGEWQYHHGRGQWVWVDAH